jgi:very-short-patch-repair endonuclease
MTEVEIILWERLKNRKLVWKKFLRQFPIYVFTENSGLDRFVIPDFVCKEHKLIIELDWSIHNLEEVYILDREKEKLLIQNWYKILRFENVEVLNKINYVLDRIKGDLL